MGALRFVREREVGGGVLPALPTFAWCWSDPVPPFPLTPATGHHKAHTWGVGGLGQACRWQVGTLKLSIPVPSRALPLVAQILWIKGPDFCPSGQEHRCPFQLPCSPCHLRIVATGLRYTVVPPLLAG